MGCTKSLLKTLLYVFNLLIVLAALALVILGIIYHLDIKAVTEEIDYTLTISSIFVIVIGCIVFVIAFLGCCGAIKENKCLLTLYAIILVVILVLQIAAGVYAFLEIDDSADFKDKLENGLKKVFDKYGNNEKSKKFVDSLQSTVKCCGVKGANYWGGNIPGSCCNQETTCNTIPEEYNKGCTDKLYSYLEDNVKVIGYVAIGFCIIELVPAIFAFCLCGMIR